MIYETTRDIAAPAPRAWDMLSAVEAWPQWLPTVDNVEALDGSPLQVGRRYRITQPKLRPAVWKVTEIEPGHRFVWRAASPGLEMIAEHAIESVGEHARVRLSYEFRGLLGGLLGKAFGRLTRDYIGREAETLKARAEGIG
jgi:uncharacterized membrane protein